MDQIDHMHFFWFKLILDMKNPLLKFLKDCRNEDFKSTVKKSNFY